MAVVFEGRDAAGKGGVIRAMTEKVSSRSFRVEAFPKPTGEEKENYFERYRVKLPKPGEVVIFDRSWYNRAGVEYVMNFDKLPKEDLDQTREKFFEDCTKFERDLSADGIVLVKFWLEVSWAEQQKRIRARIQDPLRQWKLSPVDAKSLWYWSKYSEARDVMLKRANETPWVCVDSNDKRQARLNCIAHFLSLVDYEYTDRVSERLMELHPDQMPSLLAEPDSIEEIQCIPSEFFKSAKSTNNNWRLNKEARVLQRSAFDALLANKEDDARDLIKKSIESDKRIGASNTANAPLLDSNENVTPEQQTALDAWNKIYREAYNPNESYIINIGLSLLRQLEKMGLMTCIGGKSFGPTEEMRRLVKEQPAELSKKFDEAKHLADLWKRSKLRKRLSTSQNQGVPPSMGWPLVSGVHVAYKNGVVGKGVAVALLDMAVWQNHPDLTNKEIVYMEEAGEEPLAVSPEDLKVGTEIAGIIASDQIGIAPSATLCQVTFNRSLSELTSIIEKLLGHIKEREENLIVFWPYPPADYGEQLVEIFTELNNMNVLTVTAQTRGDRDSSDSNIYNQHTLCVSTVGWNLEPTEHHCDQTKFVGYGATLFAPTYPTGYAYFSGAGGAGAYACGIAALTWAANPKMSCQNVRKHLESSALRIKKNPNKIRLLRYVPTS